MLTLINLHSVHTRCLQHYTSLATIEIEMLLTLTHRGNSGHVSPVSSDGAILLEHSSGGVGRSGYHGCRVTQGRHAKP